MDQNRLRYLFEKQAAKSISAQEDIELHQLLLNARNQTILETYLREVYQDEDEELKMDEATAAEILQLILSGNKQPARMRSIRPLVKYMAAAAVLLFAVIGYWYFQRPAKTMLPGETTVAQADIKAPELNRAAITLANGQTIYLDSAANGSLANVNNVRIVKEADGKISYKGSSGDIVYNTVVNPRGSKVINIVLADGTGVWLNAGSTLRYPVAFAGNERKVNMTGEAYFEVAHLPSMPFKVIRNDVEVKVLGTHFNVNAYDDEPAIKVTLLEGAVRLTRNAKSLTLQPGEQGIVSANAPLSIDHLPNVDQVIAWKNGYFSFSNADLPTVMRQLSRWYDIDIIYAGTIPPGSFKGEIPADLTLSQLLNGLSSTRLRFKVEGKKLTVLSE